MNTTTAKCGHLVWAVGSPGSIARRECEAEKCPQCQLDDMQRTAREFGVAVPTSLPGHKHRPPVASEGGA
jgi:hypothetical protein